MSWRSGGKTAQLKWTCSPGSVKSAGAGGFLSTRTVTGTVSTHLKLGRKRVSLGPKGAMWCFAGGNINEATGRATPRLLGVQSMLATCNARAPSGCDGVRGAGAALSEGPATAFHQELLCLLLFVLLAAGQEASVKVASLEGRPTWCSPWSMASLWEAQGS